MLNVRAVSSFEDRAGKEAARNAWKVYPRLIGYAWNYRKLLLTSLLFAIISGACFSGMIVTIGIVVRVVFGEPQAVDAQVGRVVEQIQTAGAFLEDHAGWAPANLDDAVWSTVTRMREQRSSALVVLSVGLLFFAVAGGLARFVQGYTAGLLGVSITIRLVREMFRNVIDLSLLFFERHTTGEIVSRFTNDAFMVNRGLTNVFVRVFSEPIRALFCIGLALAVNWQLTLLTALVFPPMIYAIFRIGREVKKRARRSLENVASLAGTVTETVRGMPVVKGFSMEDHQIDRVEGHLGDLRHQLKKMVRADATIVPITQLLLVLGLVLFLFVGERAVTSAQMDSGSLVILVGALAALLDPIMRLSMINNMIQASAASAERVLEYVDLKPDIEERPDAITIPRLREAIRFDDVRFGYDDEREVLSGVTFEIRKGEMVALVGFSGSGKTTIAKLIPRFYDVKGGAIAIDGVDIRDASFRSLRDQISIVTQESILFNESVSENIAFGSDRFSAEQVSAAARAAHAEDFVQQLPRGYGTILTESGGSLSGGQRQRLAIARAVLKDPAILILDEATSSLDSESERAIQQAIEENIVGRTTLVIAHRLSTVRRADRILVLDQGRIVEEGTHHELIALGGLYKRLHDVQFQPEK
ncbi:MAG: ABC transporter ATP-binding protein [Candidatus Hydrogenedentota bacterium]